MNDDIIENVKNTENVKKIQKMSHHLFILEDVAGAVHFILVCIKLWLRGGVHVFTKVSW